MRTQTKHLQDFTLTNGDEIELEAGFAPSEYHDAIVVETDDLIVMGYLVHDDDCENPLESCDAMGSIHHHPAALHDARFVKYRKTWYDVLDTQRIVVGAKHTERMGWAMYVQPCNEFAKWHAIVSETYFSGVLFRFIPDEGHVICGRYCS